MISMHEYSVTAYGSMLADTRRVQAYETAIRRIVKPGAVVIDLGTGSGVFALLACRAGARRVFAIESGDIIQLAREIAQANGCANRIEFIQGASTEVTLPERGDALVSDIRGVLPLFEEHIPAIVDARRRLLSPGGALIPRCDTIWVTVAEAPEEYGRIVGPWGRCLELDMRAGEKFATNSWCKVRIRPEQLLLEPQCWATLDYSTIGSPDVRGAMTWVADRAATAHGLVAWFDAVLADGVRFSSAPGEPEMIFGQAFYPFSTPVPLTAGDIISVDLQAKLVNGQYVWRWDTRVMEGGDRKRLRAEFKQATFYGTVRSSERLRKWREST